MVKINPKTSSDIIGGVKSIYEGFSDFSIYSTDSVIFNSFDIESIMELKFYKKDQIKPGTIEKFIANDSSRLVFNFFYPLLSMYKGENSLFIYDVEFNHVHFEWQPPKTTTSPIDAILISDKSKIVYFLECKYQEPLSSNPFSFSTSYFDILSNKKQKFVLDIIKPLVIRYEQLCLEENIQYGSGISQNLRQIMTLLMSPDLFALNKCNPTVKNILINHPKINEYKIWFGNLLFYDSACDNAAGDYFKVSMDFSNTIRNDFKKLGIYVQDPISYKDVFKNNIQGYIIEKNGVTLSEYLHHNYFK